VRLQPRTVSAKLVTALVIIALVVSGAIITALFTFDRMQKDYDTVSRRALPMLAATSRLSGTANAIAAAAPALAQTESDYSRRAINDRVADQFTALNRSIDEMKQAQSDISDELKPEVLGNVRERRDAFAENLAKLDRTVRRRIEVEERLDQVIRETFRMGTRLREIEASGNEVKSGVPYGWLIEADWALTSILSLPVAQTSSRIDRLAANFERHADLAAQRFAARASLPGLSRKLIDTNADYMDLVEQAKAVSPLRKELLVLKRQQRGLLADSARLSSRLSSAVANLYFHVQAQAERRQEEIAALEAESTALLIGALAVSLLLVAGLYLYVRGNVLRRLSTLKAAMFDFVEGGRSEVKITGKDEITDMGRVYQFMIGAISEREQHLTEARNHALELANDAEAANRSKSMFLANMSHELRTPLNAIIGFAEMIQMLKNRPERNQEYAGYISESGKHLLAVINDVLDFSKIEAGKRELDLKPVRLSSLSGSVAPMIDFQIREKKLTLTQSFQGNDRVLADEQALKQVLLNLLSNAVKFSHESGEIRITGQARENGWYILEVRDDGIGISETQLSEIMKPFHQERNEYQADGSGTGLGLAIADNLMRLHGATIEIDSRLGEGTRVQLVFPPAVRVDADGSSGDGSSSGSHAPADRSPSNRQSRVATLRPASQA